MWPIRSVDDVVVQRMAQTAQVSPLIARILWLRGVRDAEAVRRWLSPSFSDLHPSVLLPDYKPAVERIRQAIAAGEGILVWGHDDMDGISATCVLYRLLSDLRANVKFYVPVRGVEKHGLYAERALAFKAQGVKLIVTVDCGITNIKDVAQLKREGVDVVVTDHHEVIEGLPETVASVDPKRPDSLYPYRGLAGVGVALKLGMGLVSEMLGIGFASFFSTQPDLVVLAVLGTIADRAPLTGENRTLVMLGMKFLDRVRQPALRLVVERLAKSGTLVPAKMVVELPQLFAAAEGTSGVENLLSQDEARVREWLDVLERRAAAWREEAAKSLELAWSLAQLGDGIVLARSREFGIRTLGYCATRLKERYRVPALVMGWRGDAWIGEGRSVEGVNLVEVLREFRQYFIDYGGHKAAAGFTILDEKVEEFIRAVEAYAHENIAPRLSPAPGVEADATLPLAQFDVALRALAPFGEGNPAPLFVSEPVSLKPISGGWVCSARPELLIRPARPDLWTGSEPVLLLYTMEDSGNLLVLDVKPAAV